jgi:hypothetical protein
MAACCKARVCELVEEFGDCVVVEEDEELELELEREVLERGNLGRESVTAVGWRPERER